MSVSKITCEELVKRYSSLPIIDVRSEGEYNHAHIPGAYNLPLFNNEERKIVGTIYKQQNREQAIKKGLDFFGPKMKEMILFAERVNKTLGNNNSTFIVHCWRGGMRSAAVAWLLDMYGFKIFTIQGGYKSYRNWVLNQFEKNLQINIVGGYTGSGKTLILQELFNKKETVIDLEGIAGHRGSAFGRIGLPEQTSVEMFENKLAKELNQVSENYPGKPIWMEDESQRIGAVSIPHLLWASMRKSKVYFLNIPFKERLNHLVDTYGKLDKQALIEAITRIQKKLGGLEAKTSIDFLNEDKYHEAFEILLRYYDKLYLKSLKTRENKEINESGYMNDDYKIEITADLVDTEKNAAKLIQAHYGNN
jgi:tRNA 2-selenouridine synthase